MHLELRPILKFATLSKETSQNLNDNNVGYVDSFWTIKGRLRRRVYFVRILVLAIFGSLIATYMDTLNVIDSPHHTILFAISTLLGLVIVAAQFITAIKRAHDINHPGWYLIVVVGIFFIGETLLGITDLWLNGFLPLLPLIPLLIYSLLLFFKDGTPGPNKYGEDPKGRGL